MATDLVTVNLQPLGKTVTVNRGTSLVDVLHEYGVEFPCGGKGICGNCRVKLLRGELKADRNQQERLGKLHLSDEWRLACFCAVDSDVTLEIAQLESIILADNTPFDFCPGNGCGIAIDVGTTTLVAQLLDLQTGAVLDVVTALNPQTRFGSDVISRIQSGLEGNAGAMCRLIREKTGEMIVSLLAGRSVEVSKIVLVGNTAMHHLFGGFDLAPLSFFPFESPSLSAQSFTSDELDWKIPGRPAVTFFPSIGSFVGSDILAGIAATRMTERQEFTVLIDLGTNGEIACGNRDGVLCASTAAGPAFEGASISQGMRAATGAISSVTFGNGGLCCTVIGNTAPRGICGSGLVDAMAVLIEGREIGEFGEILSGEEKLLLQHPVYLSQQDIREFQLAKAAVATGVSILLSHLGITFSQVDQVFIAGGFGNYLRAENLVKTGIVETDASKIVKVGNTALIGAKMFLFEEPGHADQIRRKTSHLNLESDPLFQEIYIEKLQLY